MAVFPSWKSWFRGLNSNLDNARLIVMKRKIGTQLEDEVYRDLKMAAAQERRPISDVIQVAITDYLNQKKRKAGHQSGLKRFLASPAFNLTEGQFRETMETDYYDQ